MEQFYSTSKKSIGLVYLAKCLIAGLGVSPNIGRGLELLKSNPACETTYALGHCYLDGLPHQGLDNKKAAYDCFQFVIQNYNSPQSIIAEAQCTLARMLFQGEGVQQDTQAALNYLMKSAENNNM
jgi:TPR repeat protein